jgi:cytochrome b
MSGDDSSATRTILVWDRVVRVGHWGLALTVLFAWLTRHSPGPWHEWIGYASLAIIAVRIVWGWRAAGYARFAEFVSGPRETLLYARALVGGREPRRLGHNPLGGWMIVALLITATIVGASGWLYTTDRFWGVEWVESVHRWFTNALWVLVGLHVAGVLYTSLRHRENLLGAMLHGRKTIGKGDRSTASSEIR